MLSGRYKEDEGELGAHIVQVFWAVHIQSYHKAMLRLSGQI